VNATYVFEKGISRSSVHEYEKDVACRWWALPLYVNLPLTNGESYQLIYAGRPGGSTGPDIRDAILSFSHAHSRSDVTAGNNGDQKTTGDVEIHIRATDWFAHQHHTDKRYNNVVLHIVLICDNSQPTLRQDGTVIPTCSLNDIYPTTHNHQLVQWPCQHVITQLDEKERFRLFFLAGMLRFEMKAQDSSYLTSNQNDASIPRSHHTTPVHTRQPAGLQQLRNIFKGLGSARTDILICNVVLPFAAAVAQREDCPALTESAQNLYQAHPGLASNQITRAMCQQLLLKSEPKGACQQQGLHHIYVQTCRDKRCHECLVMKQEHEYGT
jgi:uncharacterized protein DUF2851